MSGQRRDPVAISLRAALRLASVPYGVAVAARNRRFESRDDAVMKCGVPVISVGNVTTGGTGKTPIVCFLAKWFRERRIRVAIVSRGYGRGEADSNDEALELHARLPDVPHVQDPDRVAAATIAVDELEAQVVLMDDGFQHRRLHRDLDILVIDATCPFGYGFLLPRGLLREPVSSLSRADFVVITRCDAVDDGTVEKIEARIRKTSQSVPIVRSSHRPTTLLEYPATPLSLETVQGKDVGVISAIGNPDAFEETVRSCGANLVDGRRLPDHDPYSPETVNELREWIRSLGSRIDYVLCTHKDLVKLRTDRLGGKPLASVQIELTLQGESDSIDHALEAIADQIE